MCPKPAVATSCAYIEIESGDWYGTWYGAENRSFADKSWMIWLFLLGQYILEIYYTTLH